jgi:MerR family transcriptional regulator/heat shock protein HspR
MATRKRRGARRDPRQGVYMISVAAELAGMHPQTLRLYEARGLITPQRSAGRTRLYSDADVERLRRIQELTDMGMNLAGVERVFELEEEIERLRARLRRMEAELARTRERLEAEIERVHKSYRAELVPYEAPGSALIPVRRQDVRRRVEIHIEGRS